LIGLNQQMEQIWEERIKIVKNEKLRLLYIKEIHEMLIQNFENKTFEKKNLEILIKLFVYFSEEYKSQIALKDTVICLVHSISVYLNSNFFVGEKFEKTELWIDMLNSISMIYTINTQDIEYIDELLNVLIENEKENDAFCVKFLEFVFKFNLFNILHSCVDLSLKMRKIIIFKYQRNLKEMIINKKVSSEEKFHFTHVLGVLLLGECTMQVEDYLFEMLVDLLIWGLNYGILEHKKESLQVFICQSHPLDFVFYFTKLINHSSEIFNYT
jgi:hypothetical protein